MREEAKKRQTEREIFHPGLLSKWAELGWLKARIQELYASLPYGCRGTNT